MDYKWKALITVAVGVWMIVLDSTIVNVAFPTLRREFGAGFDETQWIISIYVLALGMATPLAGSLSDRFGMKRVYGVGLGVFVLGSLLSGLARHLWFLIAARALQGLGGGIVQPLSVALLFMAFPPREQGYAFGIFGVIMVGAPALGPLLGGALVDRDLWRWIFFINVPIGVLGIALAAWLLEPRSAAHIGPLNPASIITAVVGFGCVLYGASIAGRYGWTSLPVLAALGVGGAALVSFAVIELYFSREPLLDLRLFKNRTFANANLVGYVSVIALFGAEFIMPVYLQALRGRTAFESGLILLPLATAAGVVNPFAGRIYDKIGPRLIVATGAIILLLNTWQLRQLTATTSTETLLVLLAMRGIAISLMMQATFTTALGSVPRESVPRGSSLVNSTRFIAQAIGVALLVTVLNGSLSPEARHAQSEQNDAGPSNEPVGLCANEGAGASINRRMDLCDQYLRGIRRTYTVTFCAALVAFVGGAFLPGWPEPWHGRETVGPAPA
jgi:EmrB/QacA subfamily drug resistance transporter